MDCKDAQKLSDRYLAHDLPADILPEYLKHIRSCPACMENLRTDYAITKAIDQINRGEDFSTDYNRGLEAKLERSRQSILRRFRIHVFKRVVMLCVITAIALYLATRGPAPVRYYAPSGSEESLRLRYYGISEEADPVRIEIRERNEEVIRQLRKMQAEKGQP